jgi:DNA-binding NarL/FixJ family response regulator
MKSITSYCFLIADDHSIVRNGLALVIKSTFDNVVLYQAANFDEIKNQVAEIKIDLLILDINFPEGNTLSILPQLKTLQPIMKILIFTSYDEDVYALRYIKAGADGYLSKLCSPEEIQLAITRIMTEGKYMSSILNTKIIDSFMLKTTDNPLEKLSERELEIATLLVKGFGNLEISNELNLKATTVSTYKARIFEKLEVTNLPALIQKFELYKEAL